jgi:hypothetical protein
MSWANAAAAPPSFAALAARQAAAGGLPGGHASVAAALAAASVGASSDEWQTASGGRGRQAKRLVPGAPNTAGSSSTGRATSSVSSGSMPGNSSRWVVAVGGREGGCCGRAGWVLRAGGRRLSHFCSVGGGAGLHAEGAAPQAGHTPLAHSTQAPPFSPPCSDRRSEDKAARPGGQDGASVEPTTKLWMGGIDGAASAETVRTIFGRWVGGWVGATGRWV